jgi:hypothetical protein
MKNDITLVGGTIEIKPDYELPKVPRLANGRLVNKDTFLHGDTSREYVVPNFRNQWFNKLTEDEELKLWLVDDSDKGV